MALLLQPPRAEFAALLDAYAEGFDWYCFSLSCGHAPSGGQDRLQALYQAQARWRGHRMQELYPLVCAHWDVVNLAHQIADARTPAQRWPLDRLLRQAKTRHRGAVLALRSAWGTADATGQAA